MNAPWKIVAAGLAFGPGRSGAISAMKHIPLIFVALIGYASAQSSYFISTVVGSGNRGFSGDGGVASLAMLADPSAVAVDIAGNLYVADSFNNRIRRVTPAGIISTVAGSGSPGPDGAFSGGLSGDGGPATAARIAQPSGVAIDGSGNLFIAEPTFNRIRKVTLLGTITTVVGGGICSFFTEFNVGFSGDGGLASAAQIACPTGVAVDAVGNYYIADTRNNRVRRVTPVGIITTVAGSGPANSVGGFGGDGGPATAAMLSQPSAIVVDAVGNLVIADTGNNRIRKVTVSSGIITTVAGSGPSFLGGDPGFNGDGGLATLAQLSRPSGITVDVPGNIYIADSGNNRIRRVAPSGIITTVAGSGPAASVGGFSGDGGPATAAQLSRPVGVAVNAAGNLFISDYANQRIRDLSAGPAITSAGVVNAASGVGGSVAPGEFVAVYGSGLGPSAPVLSSELAKGLATTRVFFNGIEAFTTYVSSSQINVIVPFGVAGSGLAELQVEYQSVRGNRVSLPVVDAAPGIFTTNGSGIGPAVVVNQDGTFNSPANPASRGSIISFWATGQGQTSPPGIDGIQPQSPAFPVPALPVSATIGGIPVPQRDVLFAGLVYCGVLQVNVRIPTSVIGGNLVELLVTLGTATSIQGATLPAVTLSVR
jgi:uncharacterized protein (TIGR03437 family)